MVNCKFGYNYDIRQTNLFVLHLDSIFINYSFPHIYSGLFAIKNITKTFYLLKLRGS